MIQKDISVLHIVKNGSHRLNTRFTYSLDDPCAVHIEFFEDNNTVGVERVIERGLLNDGQKKQAGKGDVRVRRVANEHDCFVILEVRSPEGMATFCIPPEALASFLKKTYDLVPQGQESKYIAVQVDDAIRHLLSELGREQRRFGSLYQSGVIL